LQRDDLDLTGEVLLSYGMQAFVCVLVASLLLVYSRKPGGGHLRWWSLSWIACALYVGMAALAISSVYFLRMPATDVRRISLATVAAVAGLFQPYFMWLGAAEALSGVPVEDRLRRKRALAVLVLALAIGIASTWLPGTGRILTRLSAKLLCTGVVFVGVAWTLWKRRGDSTTRGAAVLALSSAVYGLGQIHALGWAFWREVAEGQSLLPYYLGFFDVILLVFMGLGMLMWHLEEEHRRAEDALVELAHSEEGLRQAQKMEVVGRLAGGVAHDFNNLMTVMYGATDMLALSHPPGTSEHVHVRSLEDALSRARGLTTQLLAFSRKQVARTENVDLVGMVRSSEGMLARLLGTDVVLRTQSNDGPQIVRADPAQLSQVLMNLVVNARDAMPKGGQLSVVVSRRSIEDPSARERLGIELGSYASLAVTDTGIGMDEQVREHLFEPFFTTKPAGEGTGLGLSTAYGIVRAAGGAIEVRSELGRGSTFTVYWPLAPEGAMTPSAVARAEGRSTQATRTGHVLVVDDEGAIRDMLARLLRKHGLSVTTATDGLDALRHIEGDEPFDLLVTDMIMPGMDGSELIAAARARRPSLAVLAISGYAGDLARRNISADVPWLQKPFSAHDLIAAIDRALAPPRS
jgi:signal transduction histidine kinase